MPPPNAFLILFAFEINFAVPIINEPTGEDKPFDRQQEMLSACFVRRWTSVFNATDALKILAPSMCIFKLYLLAISFTELK